MSERIAPSCCQAGISFDSTSFGMHYLCAEDDMARSDAQWEGPGWYLVYDSGFGIYRIAFCPFCGQRLPEP
jgi:hypothetical protein